ncbi:plasma membrane fusion protein prm1 [Arachnomyces sp. PD_36]|nr:plasma membrane fusion protein prm1 [Arachnomyces sp. PD_36]
MRFPRPSGPSILPPLPPYAKQDRYAAQEPARPGPLPDSITPYLGLKARLSQVWINRWTILLLLVLVRTLIAISGLDNDLSSAKREALSACTGVESMGSAMASMPHYMSAGVNELTASGVENAVNGLMSMLLLSVTGVEEIVVFVINMLTQTYVCLITLAVTGAIHVALGLVEEATKFLNETLGDIESGIKDGMDSFEGTLNDFLEGFGTLTSALGSDLDPPELDFSDSLDALDNLQLPSSLTDSIEDMKDSIPDFEDVKNFTNNAIRTPFELVKKLINESMVDYEFDRSVFPVPAKEKLSFCSDNNGINGFFDDLASLISTAQKIFIGVLVVGAILACVPMAWREIRKWRTMKARSLLVRRDAYDPMDVVYIVSRPYTSTAGIKAANRFGTTRKQILVRWAFAYATSTPALFVLCLGIAGLFSCLCQYILLRTIQKEIPSLTNQVGEFAGIVVNSLNNASEQWAVSTNDVIGSTNDEINDKVFGWVNTTTGSINDTLNVFVDTTEKVLNDTFGGTVLRDPIQDVLDCLILLKIEGVQKALTWVSDHAHIDFPLMANDTFSLGAAASIASDNPDPSDSFLANPGGEASDQISEAVVRVANHLKEGIRVEALISTAVVLIWVFIALLGIIRALTLFHSREKNRGDGGGPVDGGVNGSTPYHATSTDGFSEVPLTSVVDARQARPAPPPPPTFNTAVFTRPSEATRAQPANEEEYYQDQKLGFAGQRDYDTALEGGQLARGRTSSYAELEYPLDEKR